MKNRLTPARLTLSLAGCAAVLLIMLAPSAVGSSSAVAPGSLTSVSFHSATLGEAINYNVYLPGGLRGLAKRYPVLYLLHGRGDSMSAWTQMKSTLDELIANGDIPPTIAIMPDAPWSSRASYYVDSAYRGADPGRPVETAFTQDLIEHVDSTYRTVADPRRAAASPATRWAATARSATRSRIPTCSAPRSCSARRSTFPSRRATPARASSARSARTSACSSTTIYQRLNYPATFHSFEATGLQLPMFIAVGDDEFKNPEPEGLQARPRLRGARPLQPGPRVENLTAELRVVDGGHDWDVWGPQFVEGAKYVFQFLDQAPATPMKANADRHGR